MWTDTYSWATLLGVLTPLLVAVVNQPKWSPALRQLVAVVVSIAVGVGTLLAEGKITESSTALAVVALVAGAAQLSYKALFGHLAGWLEQATSPGSDPPALERKG